MAERIDYLKENTLSVGEHVYRYWLACQFARGTVVDAACGMGYGSEMLKRYGYKVISVDKESKIKGAIVPIVPIDLNKEELPEGDTLVSFETVEHLDHPSLFISQLSKYDIVLLSTPIIKTTHTNKYHKQDFTADEVRGWFDDFSTVIEYYQRDTYIIIHAIK